MGPQKLFLRNQFQTFRTDLVINTFMESPIVASQPCSICIRMSLGSFLDYTRESLLHCGISNSQGLVFHFDENGHHRSKWVECVCYRLDINQMKDLKANETLGTVEKQRRWDDLLLKFHRSHETSEVPYHNFDNNCYDFINSFLNRAFMHTSQQQSTNTNISGFTKDSVAVQMLEPCMMELEKYLIYYRKLIKNN